MRIAQIAGLIALVRASAAGASTQVRLESGRDRWTAAPGGLIYTKPALDGFVLGASGRVKAPIHRLARFLRQRGHDDLEAGLEASDRVTALAVTLQDFDDPNSNPEDDVPPSDSLGEIVTSLDGHRPRVLLRCKDQALSALASAGTPDCDKPSGLPHGGRLNRSSRRSQRTSHPEGGAAAGHLGRGRVVEWPFGLRLAFGVRTRLEVN